MDARDDILKSLTEMYKKQLDASNYKDQLSQSYNFFKNKKDGSMRQKLQNELNDPYNEQLNDPYNEQLNDPYNEQLKSLKRLEKQEYDFRAELNRQMIKNNTFAKQLEDQLHDKKINMYKSEIDLMNKHINDKYSTVSKEEEAIYQQVLKQNGTVTKEQLADLYKIEETKKRLNDESFEAQRQKYREERQKQEQEEKQKQEENIKRFESNVKSIIKHIVDDANALLDFMVTNNIKNGLTKLRDAYETNFTAIAGYSGSDSRRENHDFIKSVLTEINANDYTKYGLKFNEEVFPEITNAVKQGFIGDEAKDIAITNAIDKKIMPWLETSSETWVQLQYNLTDERIQQIKGQQLLLQETREGNRILQSGVVQQIQDALIPSLDNVVANTTEVDDLNMEMQAKAMYLMNDMGYSKQEALKVIQKETDAYQNPYKALTSGDIGDKMLAMDNLYDTDMVGNFANSMKGSGWIGAGAFADITGLPTGGETRTERIFNVYGNMDEGQDKYLERIRQGVFNGASIYNDTVNNLPEYRTATFSHDAGIENASSEYFYDWNLKPHGMDVQELILNEVINIKNWLMGLAAVKLGEVFSNILSGKLFGGGSNGGSFISTLLTKGATGLANAATHLPGVTAGANGIAATGSLGATLSSIGGGSATVGGAAVLAPLAIGGIAAYNGIKGGIDDFKEGQNQNKLRGTTSIAGGVAAGVGGTAVAGGMLAAGAVNAWNPVGWGLLAAGGLTVLATSIHRANEKFKNAGTNVDILSGSFKELKDRSEQETNARRQEIETIQESFYSLGDENEQRKLLIDNGIIPNKDAINLSTSEMEKYIEKMHIMNDESGEKKEEILGGLEGTYSSQSKDEIKSVMDQIYGNLKGKSEEEQRKLLKQLGYSEEEINAGMKNRNNGAMSDGELWKFLMVNDTKMKGVEIESLQEKLESSKIKETTLNSYMGRNTNSTSRITTREKFEAGLGELVDATVYLQQYQKYGRKENPIEATGTDAVGFNQDTYDSYKNYILGLGEANKWKVEDVFEQAGISSDALSDYPNSLKGFAIGSTFIPNDMIALLHKGERVLTENQNKEYTEKNLVGNNSGIIQESIHDIVTAIQQQTSDIISFIRELSFNQSSTSRALNMSPVMGNTRVVL